METLDSSIVDRHETGLEETPECDAVIEQATDRFTSLLVGGS
jgi:hypothetical protein